MPPPSEKPHKQYLNSDDILYVVNEDEILGEGGYGLVIAGFHKTHGTIAAKCSEFVGANKQVKSLGKKMRNELDFMDKANHPNILQVFGWTTWKGCVSIIMELMPGGNLWSLINEGDITTLLSLHLVADIAKGIRYIHHEFANYAKLVHGDIKAENILLTRDLHCKIGDFGGARLSLHTGSKTRLPNMLKQSRQFTCMYAAPEILENSSRKHTSYSDVYSFGIVVFEVVQQRRPTQLDLMDVFIGNIKDGVRPEFDQDEKIGDLRKEGREIEAGIIETLIEIATKCWGKEPRERLSMTEVCSILEEKTPLCPEQEQRERKAAIEEKDIQLLHRDDFTDDELAPISNFKLTGVSKENAPNHSKYLQRNESIFSNISDNFDASASFSSSSSASKFEEKEKASDPTHQTSFVKSSSMQEHSKKLVAGCSEVAMTKTSTKASLPSIVFNSSQPESTQHYTHVVDEMKSKLPVNKPMRVEKSNPLVTVDHPLPMQNITVADKLQFVTETVTAEKNMSSFSVVASDNSLTSEKTVTECITSPTIDEIMSCGILVFNYEDVFCYDVIAGNFFQIPNLKTEYHGGSISLLKKKCYVVGGGQYVKVSGKTVGLDKTVKAMNLYPIDTAWKNVAPLQQTKEGAVSCACAGYIYVVGDETENNEQENRLDNERYNPETNSWSFISKTADRRFHHALAALRDQLYVLGGDGLKTVERYSEVIERWSFVAPMMNERASFAVVVLDDKLYAIAGRNSANEVLSSVERYDPDKDEWESVSHLNSPRCYHTAAVANNCIYVAGGFITANREDPIDNVELYNPNIGKWEFVGQSDDLKGQIFFVSL